MEPKDYRRLCPQTTCLNKEGERTEITPVICITTQFGKKEFMYPRFICLTCATEFINQKLLTKLIHEYTESLPLRKEMIMTLRDEIKKSARECGRKYIFIHKIKNAPV